MTKSGIAEHVWTGYEKYNFRPSYVHSNVRSFFLMNRNNEKNCQCTIVKTESSNNKKRKRNRTAVEKNREMDNESTL